MSIKVKKYHSPLPTALASGASEQFYRTRATTTTVASNPGQIQAWFARNRQNLAEPSPKLGRTQAEAKFAHARQTTLEVGRARRKLSQIPAKLGRSWPYPASLAKFARNPSKLFETKLKLPKLADADVGKRCPNLAESKPNLSNFGKCPRSWPNASQILPEWAAFGKKRSELVERGTDLAESGPNSAEAGPIRAKFGRIRKN